MDQRKCRGRDHCGHSQSVLLVGGGIKGPGTKNVQYVVLVPRTIPVKLAIPANLLEPGKRYVITITAKSPSGEVRTLSIAFVA